MTGTDSMLDPRGPLGCGLFFLARRAGRTGEQVVIRWLVVAFVPVLPLGAARVASDSGSPLGAAPLRFVDVVRDWALALLCILTFAGPFAMVLPGVHETGPVRAFLLLSSCGWLLAGIARFDHRLRRIAWRTPAVSGGPEQDR